MRVRYCVDTAVVVKGYAVVRVMMTYCGPCEADELVDADDVAAKSISFQYSVPG